MHRRRLPIGIQTFAKIRADDHYYVDKTGFIRRLLDEGSQYFLSRPRRFGKSLLLDTLGELFAGHEALFRGLAIHPHWDWATPYPVIRLSFGGGVVRNRAELDDKIREALDDNARRLQVTAEAPTLSGRFSRLIQQACAAAGRPVAVLVDEYHKPILDNLSTPAIARELRDGLRNLYSEGIHRRGPWKNIDAVEYATLEWVDWYNNRRRLPPIGDLPPAEKELAYYRQQGESAMVA